MTISATTFTHQRYLGPVQDWPLVAIHSVLLLKNDEIIAKTDVPRPAFKKEALSRNHVFDRHKILAIQGVQEAVVLGDMAIRTHRLLKRLVSFVKSAFRLIPYPYQMARSLSSAAVVQVSVNNSIQLSSRLCRDLESRYWSVVACRC